jgi:hypothetical protein
MAPTRAKARYAVTTLNLVTNGRTTIFKPPKVTSLPTVTHKLTMRSVSKKSALLSVRGISAAHNGRRRG